MSDPRLKGNTPAGWAKVARDEALAEAAEVCRSWARTVMTGDRRGAAMNCAQLIEALRPDSAKEKP